MDRDGPGDRRSRWDSPRERFARRGPLLAALFAGLTALPSLWLPFLSDDWGHLAAVAEGEIWQTPYRYFRPLCAITYWLEWQVWGAVPLPYHMTNMILAATASALVVVLIWRYTDDAGLASTAGLLFALHPYHIENVAWIAARSDLLSAVLMLGCAWTYDRWRASLRGLPLVPLVLFGAALGSKESAVVLPAFLLTLGICDRRRRPGAAEWARGYAPMLLLALLHFLVLRPLALGGIGLWPMKWLGAWKGNLLLYGTSVVLPAQTEYLADRPRFWGGLAVIVLVVLLVASFERARRVPALLMPAFLAFAVLLGPSLFAFQQRFFLLPSAVGALVLSILLRGARRWIALAGMVLLLAGWSWAAVEQWSGWFAAGRASHRLMGDLVVASRDPDVNEIVVVAMPHRVHGAPVRAPFTEALPLAGGRRVTVQSATEIDYASERADALAYPGQDSVTRTPEHSVVELRVVPGRYSRYVWPLVPLGADRIEEDWAEIRFEDNGGLQVKVPVQHGRSAFVWSDGSLIPVRPSM